MNSLLYKPNAEKIAASNLTDFLKLVQEETGKKFSDYQSLHRWSIEEKENFWSLIWKHSGLLFSSSFDRVLEGDKIQEAKWFTGSKLNFAENLLRRRDDHIAVIYESENSLVKKISYKSLYLKVAACVESLKKLGVKKGDRVAGLLSNSIEPIIAMLATTSLGAIWSSCSPDFGIEGIYNRFGQIKPKVLFATGGYYYNGNFFDCSEKINDLLNRVPSIKKTIIVVEENSPNEFLQKFDNFDNFESFLENPINTIDFVQLEFDHPLYILFSSGTTGNPKCIVHGAGGTLLQHYKELSLHSNLKKDSTLTYFTTCGWMMWNWMVSSLFMGSTVYLYDGSPAKPNLYKLWQAVDDHNINILGLSPKFLSLCQQNKIKPKVNCRLNSLQTILTTGSPLSEENFSWVYQEVKEKVQLASISGGTDIISCFVLGHPHLPVYKGYIQCIGLGMDVQVYNKEGEAVENEIGELVCTSPFPSRPILFWNDENKEKYTRTYFNDYKNIWKHGDYIQIDKKKGIVISGRSDSTLNPGGVRIGTSEIYNIVENMEAVLDAIVCERMDKDQNGEIILFVQLVKPALLNEEMNISIKSQLKIKGSPRHVPAYIFEVPDIPRTMSGKKMEMLVKKIINGEKINNLEVMSNPEVVKCFMDIYKSLS